MMYSIPTLDNLKSLATALLTGDKKQMSKQQTLVLIKDLVAKFELPGVTRSYHQIWYRARICDTLEGFSNVREMIYPPSGSLTYGRASLPGSNVLYASWNPRVALEETRASSGQIVQLISLRVREPIEFPCNIIGDYQSVFNSGSSVINSRNIERQLTKLLHEDANHFYTQVFIDSVLSEIFRKNVDKMSPNDYMISALIANLVLKKGCGLMFPSVPGRDRERFLTNLRSI